MNRLLLVPAAGRGRRLGGGRPKVLHPVAGLPMIDHLFRLYGSWVDAFVLVVNPRALDEVRSHCETVAPRPVYFETQAEPTGMLDAVLEPIERVRRLWPAWVWVTWCDQICIRPRTVSRLAQCCNSGDAAVVMPTARRDTPYVHLVRRDDGLITGVLHSREGDAMPVRGEQDTGLFAMSKSCYLEDLPSFARCSDAGGTGESTGERNLLPFVPWIAQRATVKTLEASEFETLGVNDPADVTRAEEILRREG